MELKNVFYAYPANPGEVGTVIDAAAKVPSQQTGVRIETWRQLDIPGRFVADGVLERIDHSDFIAADVTRLNFNVAFEVGYAIGKSKRVIITLNEALQPAKKEITSIG